MNAPSIVRLKKNTSGYTKIPNDILNNPTLSGQAKWILTYILSKPDGWVIHVKDITNHCADGESSVRSSLKELQKAGYVELAREPIPNSKNIHRKVWRFSDSPIFPPPPEKPRNRGFRHYENHHLSKTDSTKAGKKPKKPRSEAQKKAWARHNHTWDHAEHDPQLYDNPPEAPAISGIRPLP